MYDMYNLTDVNCTSKIVHVILDKLHIKLATMLDCDKNIARRDIDSFIGKFDEDEKKGRGTATNILNVLLGKQSHDSRWNDVKKILVEYINSLDRKSQILSFALLGGTSVDPFENYFINASIYATLHFKYLDSQPKDTYLDSSDGLTFPFLYYKHKNINISLKNGETLNKKILFEKLVPIYNKYPIEEVLEIEIVKEGKLQEEIYKPSELIESLGFEIELDDIHTFRESLCECLEADSVNEVRRKIIRPKEFQDEVVKLLKLKPEKVIATDVELNPRIGEYNITPEFMDLLYDVFNLWISGLNKNIIMNMIPDLAEVASFSIFKNQGISDIVSSWVISNREKLDLLNRKLNSSLKFTNLSKTQSKYWDWYIRVEEYKKQGFSVNHACNLVKREEKLFSTGNPIRTRYYEKKRIVDNTPEEIPLEFRRVLNV